MSVWGTLSSSTTSTWTALLAIWKSGMSMNIEDVVISAHCITIVMHENIFHRQIHKETNA